MLCCTCECICSCVRLVWIFDGKPIQCRMSQFADFHSIFIWTKHHFIWNNCMVDGWDTRRHRRRQTATNLRACSFHPILKRNSTWLKQNELKRCVPPFSLIFKLEHNTFTAHKYNHDHHHCLIELNRRPLRQQHDVDRVVTPKNCRNVRQNKRLFLYYSSNVVPSSWVYGGYIEPNWV